MCLSCNPCPLMDCKSLILSLCFSVQPVNQSWCQPSPTIATSGLLLQQRATRNGAKCDEDSNDETLDSKTNLWWWHSYKCALKGWTLVSGHARSARKDLLWNFEQMQNRTVRISFSTATANRLGLTHCWTAFTELCVRYNAAEVVKISKGCKSTFSAVDLVVCSTVHGLNRNLLC